MPPHKLVTLKDIADRAHVSQSVVSTILSGKQNGIFVSESTRQNVLIAAQELGYVGKRRLSAPIKRPTGPIRTADNQLDTHLVGLLLGRRFGGSLFTDIFYGVNSVLSPQGYHPIVLDTYADTYQKATEKEAEGLRYARDNRFAGIVLWHEGGSANVPMIKAVREEMPIVAIDRRVNGIDLDFAGTDNYLGAYEATQHLIQQGHMRIAHLTRLEATEASVGRLQGYQQALKDAGLEVNPRHILVILESGRRLDSEGIRQVFSSPERPTAISLLADFWAPPVYNELRRLGLRVPEDVALVGFDDVVQPGLEGLELSSMAQDFEGIGKTAAKMILRRIAQPEASVASMVFPARLHVRKSSQTPLRIPSLQTTSARVPAGAFG